MPVLVFLSSGLARRLCWAPALPSETEAMLFKGLISGPSIGPIQCWGHPHPQSQKLLQKTCALSPCWVAFLSRQQFLEGMSFGVRLGLFLSPMSAVLLTSPSPLFLSCFCCYESQCNTVVWHFPNWSLFLLMLIYITWLTWLKKKMLSSGKKVFSCISLSPVLLNSYQLNWSAFCNIIY